MERNLVIESNSKAVNTLIKVLFFAVIPLLILSLLRIVQIGWLPVMGLHVVITLLLGWLYINSDKCSLNIKSVFVILFFFVIGLGSIFTNNTIVISSSFFLIAMMLTALFFNIRWATSVVMIIILVQVLYSYFAQEVILIHEILIIVSTPFLGLVVIYVVLHFRNTLYQAIDKLQIAEKKALGATKAKSDFLAMMSHEIRTPLNGIIMASDNLLEDNLTGESYECANIIEKNSKSLLVILNDILDYSKIEAFELKVESINTDINKIGLDVMELFKRQINENITFSFEYDKSSTSNILTDPIRMKQILINLIGNSAKFTDNGFIKLRFSMAMETEDSVEMDISIEDSGIGIKEELKHLLFQDFQQLDSSITRKYGGTGLGLAITSKLVKLLNGEIKVESTYNVGTKFNLNFTFDKALDTKQPSSEVVDKVKVSYKGRRILVVDDNELNLRAVEMVLKKIDCLEVDTVSSGAAAIKKCSQIKYDLILMDMQMPKMDGIEATAIIKNQSNSVNHSTAIIALTANSVESDKQKCIEAGMVDFLIKPVHRVAIEEVLNNVLVK